MARILFEGHSYQVGEHESVLDTLLRHGASVPSSCRSGICQSCIMHASKGTPPAAAQHGIKETLRERKFFLACVCRPVEDMEVALPSDADLALSHATVIDKTLLDAAIVRLRLACATPFTYRAGQFINLRHDGRVRSYSLASIPDQEPFLELHVQRITGGRMSGWLHDECRVGDTLVLQGPLGDCYYRAERQDHPLLLIGTGSGLAPLWGIARDALRQGHHGPIHLFHGGRHPADLYLRDELCTLAAVAPNFHYTACVSRADGDDGLAAGRANELALARHPRLQGWRVFLCGNAAMVKSTKKRAFLAGANLRDIYADPFEFEAPAATRAAPA